MDKVIGVNRDWSSGITAAGNGPERKYFGILHCVV